jgi:hypothetical protein
MRKALALTMAICLAAAPLAVAGPAPTPRPAPAQEQEEPQPSYVPYTAEQLDNLLAPIALYPDPLLAQVLVAATFVDQIDVAARWVRAYGQNGIDDQPWDVSVKAVAHYPTVVSMMADNLDWTAAVGQAYVNQSTDVMMSVQRLRSMAQAQGNLVTTPQQEVIVAPGYIGIVPASPLYIYVPVYDPAIIFFQPIYGPGFYTWISFGTGFLIGAWLNLDFNWGYRRIYYTGWVGGGWIARCRPHIHMSPYYVNNRYRTIALNRNVVRYPVNYYSLDRYHGVHRSVTYENRMGRPVPGQRPPAAGTSNKVVDRNINIYDPNLNQFRGRRTPEPAARPVPQPTRPGQPTARPPQPGAQPAQPTARPPQPTARPAQPPKAPTARPPVRPAPAQRPPSAPAARPPTSRTPPHTFGGGSTVFNPRTASRRGQASRQQQARPPSSRPAPKHQPQQQRRQP